MWRILIPFVAYMFASASQEAAFLWVIDINNQRPYMVENASLSQAAQWRADYIEQHNYFNHCTVEGDCPNRVIKWFGCNHTYTENGNAVESLVRGTPNARAAYYALLNSQAHREHILGLNTMTKNQIYYGVGFSGTTFVFISSEKC